MSPRDSSEMAGVHTALGILAGKMDRVIASQDRMELRHEQERASYDTRLSRVERKQTWVSAVFATIGTVLGFLFSHKFT